MGSVFPPQSNPYAQDVSDPTMAASQEYRRYELDHSDNAMSEYAKLMHKHTKQQLETASRSARRRSQGTATTLTHETSNASRSSVSSTDS